MLLVRVLCRRQGVSEWTTTLVCTILLVFGSGWENILFGVQVSYNLTLLGFLAQLVLTDHDGPVDWRDAVGLLCAFVGLMSSGFGPFFIVGIAVFLLLRRRWLAAAIAAVPQLIAYGWWWWAWARDAPTSVPRRRQVAGRRVHRPGAGRDVPRRRSASPAWPASPLVATLAVVLWRRRDRSGASRRC